MTDREMLPNLSSARLHPVAPDSSLSVILVGLGTAECTAAHRFLYFWRPSRRIRLPSPRRTSKSRDIPPETEHLEPNRNVIHHAAAKMCPNEASKRLALATSGSAGPAVELTMAGGSTSPAASPRRVGRPLCRPIARRVVERSRVSGTRDLDSSLEPDLRGRGIGDFPAKPSLALQRVRRSCEPAGDGIVSR